MKVAIYTRVSTSEQSVEMQLKALREYCQARGLAVFHEYIDQGISGTKDSRPSLNQLMDDARKRHFDYILVYRFDRFARSSRHLITALEEFKSLDIQFLSYSENIDTGSPLGKAIFVIVSAMAELERNIIVERVKSGMANAKARGKAIGRKRAALDLQVLKALKVEGRTVREIAKLLGTSKSTVANYLSQKGLEKELQNVNKFTA